MMTNGLDTVADQLKAAAEQYGNEAAELEQHAKTLRDKQARVRAAMAALAGGTIRTAPVDRRIFTAADDAYIRENWGAMRQSDIARHLGRTDGAVAARAKRRGLAAPRLSRASAAVSRPAEGARERTGTSLSTHPASATAPGFSL